MRENEACAGIFQGLSFFRFFGEERPGLSVFHEEPGSRWLDRVAMRDR